MQSPQGSKCPKAAFTAVSASMSVFLMALWLSYEDYYWSIRFASPVVVS